MVWYTWKFWRFAWSVANGGMQVIDIDGLWISIIGKLWWLKERR